MPYKTPGDKQKNDRARHRREGDRLRQRARVYAATHREQKREYDVSRRLDPQTKEGLNDRARESWARNKHNKPCIQRRRRLKRVYGLTEEQVDSMLIEQNGLCAMCNRVMSGSKDPVIDHNHVTGKVRGLLHHRCNVGLPYIEDALFRANALTYLGVARE
jgi:hypothetical protein